MTNELKLANGTVHGGQGALKRIRQGKEFTGLAKIAQDEVLERLAADGIEGEMQRNAVKMQTVSDLYFPAFVKMLEEGNLPMATEYLAKWGWITSKANLAWQAAIKLQPKEDHRNITEVLASYRPATMPQEGQNAPDN